MQSCSCCQDRVASVSDIGKRAAVNEGRNMFECLYQVWLQCILHQCGHSALCMNVACSNRFIVIGIADNDSCKSFFHVMDRICQAEDSHNFGSDGNIEAAFSWHAVCMAAETYNDMTENTVIHIHDAIPYNASGINVEFISLLDVIVDHSCQKVMRSCDCMKVSGEMKVDVFHRYDLGIAAAGSTAFYAHAWSKGWFTQADHRLFAQFGQSLSEADGRRCLAFSGRCW